MTRTNYLKAAAIGSVSALALATAASAMEYNIPSGDLKSALDQYAAQTHVSLIVSGAAVKDVHTAGAKGELTADAALSRILTGTGFVSYRNARGEIGILRGEAKRDDIRPDALTVADAARPVHAASSVETVIVTSSKIKGDIQTVPIAITALSQEQLTERQIAGGPDLVKEVPNLTFTKTNFTGYNIEIRGIGTQAISAATDPAVAVSFNDVPFLRNHFFEQEFFDVNQVEVLRGPQGTLFGRNATAGVVNVISARPTDHFEAQLSADWGNYSNRRYEGMVNVPIWGDKLDLRVAGEWTKRDGYAVNEQTGNPIDGRDLWSGRVSLQLHPFGSLSATAIWEHFQEDDNRERTTKQLCARSNAPASVDGPAGPRDITGVGTLPEVWTAWLEQGCVPKSLYSNAVYDTPNGAALPYVDALFAFILEYADPRANPYADVTQSRNLRVVSSLINPRYRAKNDTFEFNADYSITPQLTLTSQTAYSKDFLYSTEDFNRFNTAPDYLVDQTTTSFASQGTLVGQDREYCDPQLGCSSRLIVQDISQEHSRQFYQELRLASNYPGPFNFLLGANYLNYHTIDDYYVLSNATSLATEDLNHNASIGFTASPHFSAVHLPADAAHIAFDGAFANDCNPQPQDPVGGVTAGILGIGCAYVDPNPLSQIDGNGHNYFRSKNPFRLHSWAAFGEVYYQVAPDVKLTGGLRFTDDKKDFDVYPSWALVAGIGYPMAGTIVQEWREFTGRAVVDWTPKLDFTDQTLVYASYSRGYKGGGANPPGVAPVYSNGLFAGSPDSLTHPTTFKPEFNNAFEIGTKNTLADGAITLNGDVFLYKYRDYQISQIVDRTAINTNFNATVMGAELSTDWTPLPGLRLGFNGGYEDATFDKNQYAIDLMDRTAGHPGWMVIKPFITQTSNCILPTDTINVMIAKNTSAVFACFTAYSKDQDPAGTGFAGYAGFDPSTAPNNGEGFTKNIGGNEMPNAPHFTTSLTADYTMPVSEDWAATAHADFYWQSQSFWRIFNDLTYDKLHSYSNVNLALIFTNAGGWQVMGYVKNVFDTTAITGAFLNSDDTALTTNVFTTDPRLMGVRITKNF